LNLKTALQTTKYAKYTKEEAAKRWGQKDEEKDIGAESKIRKTDSHFASPALCIKHKIPLVRYSVAQAFRHEPLSIQAQRRLD